MRRLLAYSGRLQRRHYDFEWQDYESPTMYIKTLSGYQVNSEQFAGSTTPPGNSGVYKAHAQLFEVQRRTTHYNPTTFHAEIEYNYYYTQFQREHALLLTHLDRLGVQLNPQIIWNAIPWSFLVDWVFGISKYLGEQKVLNMEPIVNVHRYLWSWTQHRRTAIKIRSTASQGSGNQFNPSIIDTYLPTMYETAYRRDVQLPDSSSSLFGSGLSATELSLGVALAITQERPPRTR